MAEKLTEAERAKLEPWQPDDPVDAMAESFFRQICDMFRDAERVSIFRDMPEHEKWTAFTTGILTGLIGVSFSCIDDAGRDDMMKVIEDYLPQARDNVEERFAEGRRALGGGDG